jgi:hypothetical protein
MLHTYATDENSIVIILDGDDWLLDTFVLEFLNNIYTKTQTKLTYGECLVWDGTFLSNRPSRYILPNVNLPYSQKVKQSNAYRKEPFFPLHLRTFSLNLFKKIKKADLLRDDGSWIEYAEDMAIFFPMLEMAGNYCITINKPLSVYNRSGNNHDDTQVVYSLLRDELLIRKKKQYDRLF